MRAQPIVYEDIESYVFFVFQQQAEEKQNQQ